MQSDVPQKYKPQKIGYFSDAIVIHLVDFPIYYIECLSERHFIIAGGGGSSKTGVHNQINILELVPTGDSCAADLVMKFYPPEDFPDAIMAGSLMNNLPIIDTRLATGGSQAALYHIQYEPSRKTFSITDYDMLRDKQVRTELKSIICIPNKVLTGSIDGKLSIWDVSKNNHKIITQIEAHSKAIDDIDVDFYNQQVVTLSRDEGRCVVWNLKSLELIQEFNKDFINTSSSKYNFRSCRYAHDKTSTQVKDNSNRGSSLLFACNPTSKTNSSILYKFNAHKLKEFKSISLTTDGVMAMTVSLDGKFVAVGTRSGSVLVYGVENLKRIYRVEGAHHNAVTNLQFLIPKPESLSLTNTDLCALLIILGTYGLNVSGDESANAPAFDISSLANIASNLGSNPQIMSMISSLLNPGVPKPSAGSTATGSVSDQFGMSDLDPNSIAPLQDTTSVAGEPLKRNSKPQLTSASTQAASPAIAPVPNSASSGGGLSGLMSMLPSVLPNLNLGSLNLGQLLGGGTKSTSNTKQADQNQASSATTTSSSTTVNTATNQAQQSSSGGNSAQAVINQVLTAYASGQIPNELIQLGLSGRVPSQIIELALSGQVPPQAIQMVITGQIPVSTIKAFLASMEVNQQLAANPSTVSTSAGSSANGKASGSGGLTKVIFEALFRQPKGSGMSISVPTLLGSIPVSVPTLPNVRRLGQMVGGTISNISSLIPF